jgi:hypothetical protein
MQESMPHQQTATGQLTGTRPILLSGVYRSGTTFLTAVVNNLPNVVASSSTVKYLRFCVPHHQNIEEPTALRRLLEEIAKRIATRWSLTLDTVGIFESLQGQSINHAVVYDRVMKSLLLSNTNGAQRWAEKLAMQWRDIPLFLDMFPHGQVIHIFRDPRDVTSSYKKMTYEPWPAFMDAALNCKAAMIELPKLQEEHGEDKILILRAEDLAKDLPGEMQRICEFLGESFDPTLAELDKFADIKGENWRTNSSYDENGKNYVEAAPRWERELTPEELFLVEMICQPEMSDLGYAGSGQHLQTLDGETLGKVISGDWLSDRIRSYLTTGLPEQGYRSDPYQTEMQIVFSENGKAE